MQQAHWFTVTIGDWSDDGHGKTDTHLINSSLPKEAMEQAYKAGCDIIGFDMIATMCEGYEDSCITEEAVDAFKTSGLDLYALADKWDKEEYDESKKMPVRDMWVTMWIHVCRLGATDLVAVSTHEETNINIGGYGLRA